MVVRQPMDRLQSNFCYWTQGVHAPTANNGRYAVDGRHLTFKEYCDKVCKYRFEVHTQDQHEDMRHVGNIHYFLPLEDLDEAIITVGFKFPTICTRQSDEHLNMSDRSVDWFADEDALREKCERSYSVDMCLYGTAKSSLLTLEEAIDRWTIDRTT